MKTICFDLRALQIGHEKRGIGMYIKSVLEHMPKDDNKYILYMFDKNNPIDDLGIKLNFDYEIVQTDTIKTTVDRPKDFIGMLKLVGHSFHPLKIKKPDVFVQFDFGLGAPRWNRTKNVVVAYDLIPLIMKNQYMPSLRYAWNHTLGRKARLRSLARSGYYRLKYKLQYSVYKRADLVLSISESTKNDFIKLLKIDPANIKTIHLAPVLSTEKPDDSLSSKIKKPYILYVGGTDSRKQVKDVIFAYNIARGRGIEIDLVLAGNEFKDFKKIPDAEAKKAILDSPYKKDIHALGFITDTQKLSLYQNALAFVFCSSYEGFGLPIIEAMASGCPVITYNNSSIPEAAGSAGILIPSGNYVDIAKKIQQISANKNLLKDYVEKGINQSQKFNWEKYVSNFINQIC